MALPTVRSRIAQLHVNRNPGVFKVVSRTFSLSIWQREPGSEENGHKPAPKRPYNSLLHVQTHTGVRNMAHGLHILRQIEKKFGAIESYLFPRESGTNEYHPAFFFRFRDPKSIKRLTSPFTHFDIPILALEDKPNHAIGINDIGYLISPDSREFSLVQGLELMRKETMDSVDTDSQEGAVSAGPDPPSTLKSRYAVRIAISGLAEYPQPFFSHKTINPREKPRIQQELSAWKSAYEVLGSSIKPSSQSETRPKIQTIEELLQENFNVPQDTLVLPQRKYIQKPIPHENNGSEPAEQPPQPTEYQLFKVHSRKSIRPVNGDPPPDSKPSAEVTSENDSSAEGVMSGSAAVTSSSMQSAPRISTKRERQLEQMRRAAASQVRSIAEKRRIEEEDAKRPKAESEVDHTPTVKQELSIWDRFLKR